MKFRFCIDVEVERTQGKFASREELAELIQADLEQAQPDLSGCGADGDSEYEVTSFDVGEDDPTLDAKRAALIAAALKLSGQYQGGATEFKALRKALGALVSVVPVYVEPRKHVKRGADRRGTGVFDPRAYGEQHERRVAAPSERRKVTP
jgi:hypothetical protein